MIQFYCIDGSKKRTHIESDFRPTILSSGEVYYKQTFAIRFGHLVLYADIASTTELSSLEINENFPLFIRKGSDLTLISLPITGEVSNL